MARHTWHKAPNRQRDRVFISQTPSVRCVIRELDEILCKDGEVSGSISQLAGMLHVDRKIAREAFEAIARTGILKIEREDMGKAGVFYTITDPNRTPTQAPSVPPTEPQPSPQSNPNRHSDKSANNAGSGDSSLNKILPSEGEIDLPSEEEGEGDTHAHAREDNPTTAEETPPAPPLEEPNPYHLVFETFGVIDPVHYRFQLEKAILRQASAIFDAWSSFPDEKKAEWLKASAEVADARRDGGSKVASLMAGILISAVQEGKAPTRHKPEPEARPTGPPPVKPREIDPERMALVDRVSRIWVNEGRYPEFGPARHVANGLTTEQLRKEYERGSAA